ncbi:TetR/AcrR family transcriptional regulator [Kitasatospora paracochleata]|uniref:AcrR family transcriptional regulator n=1 Tax=Kitasatospora paracochleata TaxID=58354 RepID=A0ABT1IR09_9ACTN|nr:TetR/AcrR family transcriptional regulator [Kitasatospora paracochleata]MCP2307563.1 AcrR family transcriptional regulator [Kitasatospora paracochleata]
MAASSTPSTDQASPTADRSRAADQAPGSPARPAAGPERPRRAGYRRLPVQQRREQLISVALELFGSRPPEAVTLDDVAEAAGASRPLVYRYFAGGKQQLYEAALRSAAEELIGRFSVAGTGTPTEQLTQVLARYFAFVAEHDAGYGALLRGGSVVETSRTSAIIDEVRRKALRRTLRQFGVRTAGPRLTLLVRSWISVVEASALSWLDEGRQIPPEALCAWLVDQFVAMAGAAAVHDPQTAEVLHALLALETAESPAGVLLARLRAVWG